MTKTETICYTIMTVVLILFFALLLHGCYQDASGGWRLGQDEANQIEQGLDATAEGIGLVSLFIPGATAVAGVAAGIAGAFKKLKPELTKQKETTEHVVTSIEKIKEDYPDTWAMIRDKFQEGTNADIECVIEKIIALQNTIKGDNNA